MLCTSDASISWGFKGCHGVMAYKDQLISLYFLDSPAIEACTTVGYFGWYKRNFAF